MTSDTLAIAHKVANHPAFNRLAVGLRIAALAWLTAVAPVPKSADTEEVSL